MKLVILRVDTSISWEEYQKYLPCVSKQRQEKCHRYRQIEDKIRSLLAELLMKKEIAQGQNVEFFVTPWGKPYVKKPEHCCFSVSHTKNCIVYGQSTQPIGVDVEMVTRMRRASVERWFTPEEQRVLQDSEYPDLEFYRLWTLKEACLKKTGIGLSQGLSAVDVTDPKLQPYLYWDRMGDYLYSVCASEPVVDPQIVVMETRELLDFYQDKIFLSKYFVLK